MSPKAGNRWNPRPAAVAVALPYPAALDFTVMRDKMQNLRDTLIVLGMQLVFRATMLLRRLNY
jgi:hypothetical protein